MKSLRTVLIAAGISLALATAARAAEADPGFIDIGQLMPSSKGQFVEVNLSPGLLKFAAKIASHQEPEAADLIANLKRIRVNVVSLDDSNRAATIEKIESVRRKLETQGWTQMVTVREKDDGDNVDIHVKQRGDDAIDGLVITVIDHKGEAVFVNIVGNINADQISKIAEKFDIEPLKHVHMKIEQKKHDKEA
jgi:phosphoribosylanthranilate isomerase